jgi:uroporphyrinogen III methyltransferase/synthase
LTGSQRNFVNRPRVALVGAGPGDPGLITARGLQLLRDADVVLYDALVGRDLLDEAKADCQCIDVGKRAGACRLSQDQINALMVEKAQRGLFVVRLKGGDPYLFGRGAEEAAYLAEHGIPCEVVPGLTSGTAAPAAAGIPLTHRRIASTVTFATGHEDPAKQQSSIDYAALAALIRAGGTVCFYMGISRIDTIADTLMANDVATAMPAAVVQWGTLPQQRSLRGTLGDIAAAVRRERIGGPTIIVVGKVAAIHDGGLATYMNRPLLGQTIVLTRAADQSPESRRQLAQLGARVLEAPTIAVRPPDDWTAVDDALGQLSRYDWLIVTSANGVAALASRLEALRLDSRALGAVRIAAVGKRTADALWQTLRVRADVVPDKFVAERIAEQIDARGKRFLLLRADIARRELPRMLADAGGAVDDLTVYCNVPATALPDDVLNALRAGEVDWITFTSSSTVRNMVDLLGAERGLLDGVKAASIGPITSATMRESGLTVAVEADPHDMDGLIAGIVGHAH